MSLSFSSILIIGLHVVGIAGAVILGLAALALLVAGIVYGMLAYSNWRDEAHEVQDAEEQQVEREQVLGTSPKDALAALTVKNINHPNFLTTNMARVPPGIALKKLKLDNDFLLYYVESDEGVVYLTMDDNNHQLVIGLNEGSTVSSHNSVSEYTIEDGVLTVTINGQDFQVDIDNNSVIQDAVEPISAQTEAGSPGATTATGVIAATSRSKAVMSEVTARHFVISLRELPEQRCQLPNGGFFNYRVSGNQVIVPNESTRVSHVSVHLEGVGVQSVPYTHDADRSMMTLQINGKPQDIFVAHRGSTISLNLAAMVTEAQEAGILAEAGHTPEIARKPAPAAELAGKPADDGYDTDDEGFSDAQEAIVDPNAPVPV